MKLNLRVLNNDGSAVDIVASAADFVAFEQKWDRSIARFSDDFRFTDLCWLAWHTSKRAGKTSLDFDSWLETIESVDASDGAIVPLETSQPTG